MVMLQPVSRLYIVEEFVKSVGIEDGYDKFDKAVHERTGFHLSEQSPLKHVKSVTGPTLVAQVHDHDDATPGRSGHLRRHPSRREEPLLDGGRPPLRRLQILRCPPRTSDRVVRQTHQLT